MGNLNCKNSVGADHRVSQLSSRTGDHAEVRQSAGPAEGARAIVSQSEVSSEAVQQPTAQVIEAIREEDSVGSTPAGRMAVATEGSEASSDWGFWSLAGSQSSEVPREIMYQAGRDGGSLNNLRFRGIESMGSILSDMALEDTSSRLATKEGLSSKKTVSFGDRERVIQHVREFEKADKKSRPQLWFPPEELVSLRRGESSFLKSTSFDEGVKTSRQQKVIREVINSINEIETCLNIPEGLRLSAQAEEDFFKMPRLLLDELDSLIDSFGDSAFSPSELSNKLTSVEDIKALLEQAKGTLKAAFPPKVEDNVFKISVEQTANYLKQVKSCLVDINGNELSSLSADTSHEMRVQASLLIGKIEGGEVDFKPSDEFPTLEAAKSQLQSIQHALSKPYFYKPASIDDVALLKMRSARLDRVSSLESVSSESSDLTPGQRYVIADAIKNLKKVEPCFLGEKDRKTSSDMLKNASLQDDPWGLREHVDNLIDKVNKNEVEFTAKRWARSPEAAKTLLESVQRNLMDVCRSKSVP